MTRVKVTLSVLILSMSGCVSAPQQADAPVAVEKAGLLAVVESEEARRIRTTLAREETVAIGDDTVTIAMDLKLPQIEIPKALKLETQLHIKREPDKGVHVYNGHVCVIGTATSKQSGYNGKSGWKLKMKVDDKIVSTEGEISGMMIADFSTNKMVQIPEKMNLRICTSGKFPEVRKVSVTMSDKKNQKLAAFLWSAPWPELDRAP